MIEGSGGVQFLALSVQHTGTHFLGATLRHLTRRSSEGWPPMSRGPEPIGFSMRHLYDHHPLGALPWPDRAQDAWMAKWWFTSLPIVVSLRDESASFATLHRRPQHNYNEHDHRASLDLLSEIMKLDRVHGLKVDCPKSERFEPLLAMLAHLGDHGCAGEIARPPEATVRLWADKWPLLNSTGVSDG
jgi:hypothetical protein